MAVSYNEDVRIGNSVFHVQTEYYRKSGKVVSNIFKDGLSIKRLEREVEEGVDIDSAVSDFHRYVVERLRSGVREKKAPAKKKVLTLPEAVEQELLEIIYPYFGVASSLVIDEALAVSSTSGEFLEHLLEGLPDNLREALTAQLAPILSSLSSIESSGSEESSSSPEEEIDEAKREKLLKVLSEYFGIMALPVLEEALEEWNGDYHYLVELIVSHLEDEKEREELYHRLMFL